MDRRSTLRTERRLRRLRFLCALSVCLAAGLAQPLPTEPHRPKLVLTIVVDQMRYDYLTRYAPEFDSGLKRLIEQGALFTNANYEAAPTVAAVGQSTLLTGAMPALSGIVANTWYERSEGRHVQSISDPSVKTLGGHSTPASPRRLAVSTIGDELKIALLGGKVFGIAMEDRSAVLPAGHLGDGAFWFDAASGSFVSSSYYFPQLPAWVAAFNAKHPADKYAGEQWMDLKLPAQPGAELYASLYRTPFSDQLILDFAEELIRQEQLGSGPLTDLLSINLAAVDAVGNAAGPNTPRIHDMILNVDRLVGRLLESAEKGAGAGQVLVVFTADHGVAPVPEENVKDNLPGGRFNPQAERAAVEAQLSKTFGAGNYISGISEMGLYLNPQPQPGSTVDLTEAARVTAAVLRNQPHVFRVYTHADLLTGAGGDRIDQRVRNGFHPQHSPDVLVVHEPYWLFGAGDGKDHGTTHGSPFSYDTHVPLILWGAPELVKPGVYATSVGMQDVAPTLATMLGVAQPSGATGRVLAEALP